MLSELIALKLPGQYADKMLYYIKMLLRIGHIKCVSIKSYNTKKIYWNLIASSQSYESTLKNNTTEKEAILFLMESNSSFIEPDKDSRKMILQHFGLSSKYMRAFDLIQVDGHINSEEKFILNPENKITLIEIKSTKKKLENEY